MTKKKSVKRYILWGVLALLTLWLALMPLMARQQQENDGPKASILSANATVSSIRTAIHGGGTLEAGDPEDISIPADVKIEEFLVNNGDFVSEGDPLAAVDKVSVMTAITEIQDSMSTVRKQMESASDEKAATEVSATVGGRVKLVYAREGDRVESVMLEHGALAVLSLDSKMCVRLTVNSPLATGESVTVTLADGKEVTGRVESNLSGELVVTVQDKGYEVGQTVSVENTGTGTLEIHSPWKATAFAGTVSIAYAQPEQTLGAGAALFTLKDTDYTAQRETLAQAHREYEELLQKLFKMYETGVISAPCDGMVSGIDRNSAHLLAAREEEIVAQPLTAEEGEFRLVLLSGNTVCTINESCTLPEGDPQHNAACPLACNETADCKALKHKESCLALCTSADDPKDCTAANHKEDCIKACTRAAIEGECKATKHFTDCIESCKPELGDTCPATGKHKQNCIKSCIHADTEKVCTAGKHYSDCIEACTNSGNSEIPCPASKHKTGCYFQGATYSARVFKVSAVGTQELVGFIDPNYYQVIGIDKNLIWLMPLNGIVTGTVISFAAFGEEFGWRGYMMPKLIKLFGIKKAVFAGGIIWGLWHAPLTCVGHNFGTDYPGFPYLGILVMCLDCTVTGIMLTYLTVKSGSIWPAAIMHAVNNANPSILALFTNTDKAAGILNHSINGYFLYFIPTAIIAGFCLVQLCRDKECM